MRRDKETSYHSVGATDRRLDQWKETFKDILVKKSRILNDSRFVLSSSSKFPSNQEEAERSKTPMSLIVTPHPSEVPTN